MTLWGDILLEILEYAVKAKCSDIHITEGKYPVLRRYGTLYKHEEFGIMSFDMIYGFLKQNLRERFTSDLNHIDAPLNFFGRRFRMNVYKSISGINLALRIIGNEISTLNQLYLPEKLLRFTEFRSGLVLIIGTTGSGKSTTLASLIDYINHRDNVNILTMEDPIEYIYTEDKAKIEQREFRTHFSSYENALSAAMRQDFDIILVGEMRDLGSITQAITLAETGHLVFSTLHSVSVYDVVDRIVDSFEACVREQIRTQLSSVLRGVVHQTLVPNIQGGVLPLVEVMYVNDALSGMIRQAQRPNAFRDYIRGHKEVGVHIVDNAAWHINEGRLDLESVKPFVSPEDYMVVSSLFKGRR